MKPMLRAKAMLSKAKQKSDLFKSIKSPASVLNAKMKTLQKSLNGTDPFLWLDTASSSVSTTSLWDDTTDIYTIVPPKIYVAKAPSTSVTGMTSTVGPNLTVASGGAFNYAALPLTNDTPRRKRGYKVPALCFDDDDIDGVRGYYKLELGHDYVIKLPDDTKLELKSDGSFQVIDKDAKITYQASRIKEFNPYLNASDRLEEFIKYCIGMGLNKQDMLDLPVKTFIAWLIIEAAKADRDPVPDNVSLLPDLRRQKNPRCVSCQRFLPRERVQQKIEFCGPKCFERHFQKAA